MSNLLSRRLTLFILVPVAILIGVALGLYSKSSPQPVYSQATVLEPARTIGPFRLTDHHGEVFDNSRLQGKWTLMFFGYTHCPDVCPNTLAVFNLIDKGLQKNPALRDKSNFIMVSVDPDRDDVARMAEYVPYFNERFIGLTETQAGNLLAVSTQLGVVYLVRKPGNGSEQYMVDHSPNIVLFNPEGKFQAVFTPPLDPAAMLMDLETLASLHEESK